MEIQFKANAFNVTQKTIYVNVKQEKDTNRLYLVFFKKSNHKQIKEIKMTQTAEIYQLIKAVEKRAEKEGLILWSY